jgi:hypothetical protein
MESMLSDYVGKTILLNVAPHFQKATAYLLQTHRKAELLYVNLSAVDQLGLWVHNPEWITKDVVTGQEKSYKSLIMVPWHSILSVAVFPERKFENDVMPREIKVGF